MLAYLTIFATALGAAAGAPVWLIAGSTIALSALSYAANYRLYKSTADLGMSDVADETLLASMLNALAASGMAYAAGLAVNAFSGGVL